MLATYSTKIKYSFQFFYIVFAIFVAEIVGVAMVFEYLPQIREETRKSIGVYGTNSTTGTFITHGWDTLQVRVGSSTANRLISYIASYFTKLELS